MPSNNLKPELSIIIPCYNCEKTLEEALESCYHQDLNIPFEIVLVNDKSTDKTLGLMIQLEKKYPHVRCFFHEKNMGGGATRNTAVEKSLGKIIFCLDSDDILPKGTLSKMVSFLKEKKCDGVGIQTSIKFSGNDRDQITRIDEFGYAGEKIPFESLLEKNGLLCPLYSTFMITKESFLIIGGYPTKHGFDTQGFAWRFLMNGLTAYTCPGAKYLHRIDYHESYYLREYKAGKINLNWNLVLNEFIFVFSPRTQEIIKNKDLNDEDNILIDDLKRLNNPWAENIKEILNPEYIKEHLAKIENTDIFQKRNNLISRNSIRGILKRINKKMKSKINILKAIIKARNNRFDLLLAFTALKIRKIFRKDLNILKKGSEKVDIVIPTVSKDYELMNEMIEALKLNIYHDVNNIYIVSQKNEEIEKYCREKAYIFIDEISVLGYGKDSIHYKVNGVDRSGWIFQQLLKLSGDRFTEMKNYIIVDSDTILIKPHLFIKDGRFVFIESEEWHDYYFKSFEKIFGYPSNNNVSYTAHMMIFNTDKLLEMKKQIETLHGISWDKAYLSTIDENEPSCVSDYDNYANWMRINHPAETTFTPFYNIALSRNMLLPLTELTKKYSEKLKSISFHHYKN